jgi:ATP-dependent helicase/nuclease subunit A
VVTERERWLHPSTSAWVNASAGTGKTYALTERLLSLLTAGVAPESIVCLTFTNHAAEEMRSRLDEALAHLEWMDGASRASMLRGWHGVTSDAEARCARASGLWRWMADHERWPLITTLHGFCQRLVSTARLEAGLGPLRVVDARVDGRRWLRDQWGASAASPLLQDEEFLQAFRGLLRYRSFDAWLELLPECWEMAPRLALLQDEEVWQLLTRGLETEKLSDTEAEGWESWARVLLEEGTASDQRWAEAWLDHFEGYQQSQNLESREALLSVESYRDLFLTKQGLPRKKLLSVGFVRRYPDAMVWLEEEQRRAGVWHESERLRRVHEASGFWRSAVVKTWHYYQEFQRVQDTMDYDGLITRGVALLEHLADFPRVAEQVVMPLRHVLIDEAQDTSAVQWHFLDRLVEELAGSWGMGEVSLWVVGDEKQSIYGFQGADPRLYARQRERWRAMFQDSGYADAWCEGALTTSYRTAPGLLRMVDGMMNNPLLQSSVVGSEQLVRHESFRSHGVSTVRVFPPLVMLGEAVSSERGAEELAGWHIPDPRDPMPMEHPETLMAEVMASYCRRWLDEGWWLDKHGRLATEDDILILVRRRGRLTQALPHALKKRGLRSAGSDRIEVMEDQTVRDVVAWIRWTLVPSDDFSLACVLVSPWFGWTDECLWRLAHGRGDRSLWQVLCGESGENGLFVSTRDWLLQWRREVDHHRPLALVEALERKSGILEGLVASVGVRGIEMLGVMRGLAAEYESHHDGSLINFLGYLEAEGASLTASSLSHSGIRVMTVHGSKGLQAPIVWLADTVGLPRWQESVVWSDCEDGEVPIPLWVPPGMTPWPEPLSGWKVRTMETLRAEYQRLFYVALTRAEEAWVVSAALPAGGGEVHELAWYESVIRSVTLEGFDAWDPEFPAPWDRYGRWEGRGWSARC